MIIEGRIDWAWSHAESWTIVDYKTDRSEKRNLAELQLYGLALQRATGLPVRGIVLEIQDLVASSKGFRSSFGHRVVLIAGSAAHSDSSQHFSPLLERDASGKNHDLAVIGCMDAKKLSTRLRMGGEIFGGDVEGARGVSLLDRNVDAAEPGAIHADVGDQVAAFIRDGDVHGLADFSRLLFSGGNHAAGVFESDGRHSSSVNGFTLGFARLVEG
jgi:hypothetical protein